MSALPNTQQQAKPLQVVNESLFHKSALLSSAQFPKVEPASYRSWLSSGENYQRVREYEKFLTRNNVAGIVPSFELLRSARDWQNVAALNMLYLIVSYGEILYLPYAYLNI